MKRLMLYFMLGCSLFIVGCANRDKVVLPTPSSGMGSTINWNGWDITWLSFEQFEAIIAGYSTDQKTFYPQKRSDKFFIVRTLVKNTTAQKLEYWLSRDSVVLTDDTGQTYSLIGLANSGVTLTSAPYLTSTDTIASTTNWEDGYFTVSYMPSKELWYVQATSDREFNLTYVFVIPSDVEGLILTLDGVLSVSVK